MKIITALIVSNAFACAVFAANVQVGSDKLYPSSAHIPREEEIQNSERSLKSFFKKPNTISEARTLRKVLSMVDEAELETKEPVQEISKRSLVEELMVKVFFALKRSGLINSIIRMSLTDEEVRKAVSQITIDLVEADVIPYEEIFEALKESGLAIDVIRFTLTDPETRSGLVEFVKELIPQLVETGDIDHTFLSTISTEPTNYTSIYATSKSS